VAISILRKVARPGSVTKRGIVKTKRDERDVTPAGYPSHTAQTPARSPRGEKTIARSQARALNLAPWLLACCLPLFRCSGSLVCGRWLAGWGESESQKGPKSEKQKGEKRKEPEKRQEGK